MNSINQCFELHGCILNLLMPLADLAGSLASLPYPLASFAFPLVIAAFAGFVLAFCMMIIIRIITIIDHSLQSLNMIIILFKLHNCFSLQYTNTHLTTVRQYVFGENGYWLIISNCVTCWRWLRSVGLWSRRRLGWWWIWIWIWVWIWIWSSTTFQFSQSRNSNCKGKIM